jgi:hypothetical protein
MGYGVVNVAFYSVCGSEWMIHVQLRCGASHSKQFTEFLMHDSETPSNYWLFMVIILWT